MAEFILFLCVLAIVIPSLLISGFVYNLNRSLRGQKPVTMQNAIGISFKNLILRLKVFVQSFLGQGKKKKAKTTEKKPEAEDAEFKEIRK